MCPVCETFCKPRPGYDGGDCCEETCVSNAYVCGGNGGFDCLDPEHNDDPEMSFSFSFSFSFGCQDDKNPNAFCNPSNNNERCGTLFFSRDMK